MPTGLFSSDFTLMSGNPSGTSTGTGAPSQPRWGTGATGDGSTSYTGAGGWRGPTPTTATAQGSGYTAPSGTSPYATAPIQGPSAYAPGPLAQYPNEVYSPYSPTNMATSLVQSLYGPQSELLSQQLARQYDQLGMIGLDADYKTDALHRDNALAQQALGLDRAGIGIEQGLTKTQLANLDKLRAILGQQRTLAGDVMGTNTAEAKDLAQRKTFDLRSQLTARGAFNTIANERGTGRINRDLAYQLAGIEQQHRGTQLGLNEKGIGYDNQQAGLNARLANLGLDTQRLGITEQQLANQLQDGLHQIGLDSMVSVNGLLDAIGGTNAQQAQLAATILGEVAGYANLPPDVLAAITAALAGGTTSTAPTASGTPGPGATR